MGTILTDHGNDAYDHEGYAAQLLDDGTLTGTYNSETRPRMIGAVVGACGCGWTGAHKYPTAELIDEQAEALALSEWEHDHARPALDGARRHGRHQLAAQLHSIAATHGTTLAIPEFDEQPLEQQHAALDCAIAALERAAELAHQLHAPIDDEGR